MSVKVFLSHASVDKPIVEDIEAFLEHGRDIECWPNKNEIGFGQNIVSRLNDGLAKSNFVLLFLSPESMKSRGVEEEWAAQYFQQVNSGRRG